MKILNFRNEDFSTRLSSFLKRDGIFLELLKPALNGDKITIPSVFSKGSATCLSSVYLDVNCLYFECDDTGKGFFLIQDNVRAFPFAVYCPSANLGYVDGAPSTRNINRFKQLRSIKPVAGEFKGLIDFYKRPYHYFVDKIPFVFNDFLKESSVTIYTERNSAFLELKSFLGERAEEIFFDTQDELVSHINSGGIYLEPHKSYSKEYNEKVYKRFKKDVLNEVKKGGANIESTIEECPVIWLGLCAEKRKYVEHLELYGLVLGFMEKRFNKYYVIFDGLTSTISADISSSRAASLNEISSVDKLREIISKGIVVDLIGASAKEKIYYANHVDFFITNMLTDSIWVSFFNNKKGIGFGASGVKPLFKNPKMITLDEARVFNLDDSLPPVKKSFSIDPEYVFEVFKSNFKLNN